MSDLITDLVFWWLLLLFRTLYRGSQGRVTLRFADPARFHLEAPETSHTTPCGNFIELVRVACVVRNSLSLTTVAAFSWLVATADLTKRLACYMFTVPFAWNFQKPRRSLHSPTSRWNSGATRPEISTIIKNIILQNTYVFIYTIVCW